MIKFSNSHRVAIVTKYHGPTNTRGGRISADAGDRRRAMVEYDHALSSFDAHAKAAQALCDKFAWSGEMHAGGTETGFVFVFTGE